MNKKIVILEGSPRKGGNTGMLAAEFIRGAEAAGHQVQSFHLADLNIHPCINCDACRRSEGPCVFRDDFDAVIEGVIACDALVLASPVYFYSLSGQIKTCIDRFYALERKVRDKKSYFLTSCAAPTAEYAQTAIDSYRGFIRCLRTVTVDGIVCAAGMKDKGSVAAKGAVALAEAYELGRSV